MVEKINKPTPRKPADSPSAAPKPAIGTATRWVAAFVDYARSECHLAANTVAAYRRDMAKFTAWVSGRDIRQLTIRDLADYATWLHQRKLAPASIARHLVSLKVFFRYLQLEGVLRDNLAELLGSQKLWQRVPQVLSAEAVEQLLASPLPGEPLWRRDRALLELLYATGCRASEVSHLAMSDLHLSEGYCLCRGKGDRQRISPINRRAIEAIQAYLEHERPQLAEASQTPNPRWLLLSHRGLRLARERIWELMKRYAARIGAPPSIGPHTMRHSFATHMVAGGDRPPPDSRNARPCEHRHDADLYPRRLGSTQKSPPPVSSPRMKHFDRDSACIRAGSSGQ